MKLLREQGFVVKYLGIEAYENVLAAQQQFTRNRGPEDPDELWVVGHPPVFTLGQTGKTEHVLDAGVIPLVQSDRGGQVTFHGPGQVVIYTLLNIRRLNLTVKSLVTSIEQSVLDYLRDLGVQAETQSGAPGVYVQQQKIAALGLRITRGYSYHGLSFNVAMDLAPFKGINPCGYEGLEMTDLKRQGVDCTLAEVEVGLTQALICRLKAGKDQGDSSRSAQGAVL
ncbi:MAG: lipoyl(octanoyl) transferase LipB [Pseudomonadales bacterium]|jgi:lipoyl(octanoyl) transferase|tara:strand:+ start:323 stop:997 length:675 start_codon:yes stop_codon:yes gene_type:complete